METLAHYHFQTVHFPIALTLTSALLLLVGRLRQSRNLLIAGRYLLYLATVGALAAMTTGLMAEEFLPHSHEGEIHDVMEWHQTLGIGIASVLALTSVIAFVAEKKNSGALRNLVLLLVILLAAAVSTTGYLGGRLGHEFGIGIEAKAQKELPPSEPDPAPTEGHPHDHHHTH